MKELLEKRIAQLDGIISVKVIMNGDWIDEIHVIANNNRIPKNIVRDIETLIQVEMETDIDHRKISIAQLEVSKKREYVPSRITLYSISHFHNKNRCEICLYLDDSEIRAEHEGGKEDATETLVAETMLKAISSLLPQNYSIKIEHTFTTGFNNELLVIQLKLITRMNTIQTIERLAGISYIDQNLTFAVARAFLSALNRRIHFIINPIKINQ